MLKSGMLLTFGNMVSALILMARNILIARLISVADMGVASTFAITMAVLEMMSDFALNQMLIQDRKGDTAHMKSTLQLMQVLRGIITGAILYLFAAPYASLLSVPDIAWAFQLMALIPIIRGFGHLDIFQLQRQLEYRPFLIATVLPQIVSVLVIWPLAQIFGDWRVMLYALLIQHTLYLCVSHAVARSRFAMTWDKALIWRALGFGWPLLLNGVLMFAILNGDRVIVANVMNMSDLGLFALAYTMSMAPTLIMAKTLQSFFLPQLSARQDDLPRFKRMYLVSMEAHILVAAAFVLGIAIFGPTVFILLLGDKYLPALGLLLWLGIMQSVRLAKGGPSVVAIAKSHTRNPMIANVARVMVLPAAWYIAVWTENMLTLAWVALAGETISILVSLWLLRSKLVLPLRPLALPFGMFAIFLALAGVYTFIGTPTGWLPEELHLYMLVLIAGFIAVLASCRHGLSWLMERLRPNTASANGT